MSVVALRLAGPLQSWGSRSRFVRRDTEPVPTKSGVLGMVAAAKGLRRTDPIEELLHLRFAVRVDQPGRLIRDFQTAQRPRIERDGSIAWQSMPLSYRYYMSDAVYLALLEGDRSLVEAIDEAVRRPHFPLYLGRRSCPPAGPVARGLYDTALEAQLADHPWLASERVQSRARTRRVRLATVSDAPDTGNADDGGERREMYCDVPVSFDPDRRQYRWRHVIRGSVEVDNPRGVTDSLDEHDPLVELEA